MTVHVMTGTELSTGRRKPSDLVREYETKLAAIPAEFEAFQLAATQLQSASTVGGEWGQVTIDTGRASARDMERALLSSAWRHAYRLYDLAIFASAKDKDRLERMFAQPVPFTIENFREWFGAYVLDPRGSILRGLAEVFADLDPAFKSHEKMKIGVKGLPKRIILSGVSNSWSYGSKRLESVLNALAAVQGKPMITSTELSALHADENALLVDQEVPDPHQTQRDIDRGAEPKFIKVVGRGIWLRKFQNGNGHLFFTPETLRDINMALAEYYGDVIADCPEERPARRASTEVSKDLQYYPTPGAVVERVLGEIYRLEGAKVLEPQCGCGRFLDGLRAKGAIPFGIEVDASRAAQCRAKGHSVQVANFLEVAPSPDFDHVVMNPPFYGKHYAKHVRHALKFLRPGGTLTSILPITARHDHGLLDDLNPSWSDLPVGSFSESGTNINTTVITVRLP